jgi:hypothetical protein
MALTADKARKTSGYPEGVPYLVAASTIIYQGSLVATNSTGFLVPAANNTTHRCGGVAAQSVDNSDGSDGDVSITVESEQLEVFASSGIVQADVGEACYVLDDETVADNAASSKNVHVGTIKRLISTNLVLVKVSPQQPIAASPT